jgi:hypothetical protein
MCYGTEFTDPTGDGWTPEESIYQRWLRKSGQRGKWIAGLMAARMAAAQEA